MYMCVCVYLCNVTCKAMGNKQEVFSTVTASLLLEQQFPIDVEVTITVERFAGLNF